MIQGVHDSGQAHNTMHLIHFLAAKQTSLVLPTTPQREQAIAWGKTSSDSSELSLKPVAYPPAYLWLCKLKKGSCILFLTQVALWLGNKYQKEDRLGLILPLLYVSFHPQNHWGKFASRSLSSVVPGDKKNFMEVHSDLNQQHWIQVEFCFFIES